MRFSKLCKAQKNSRLRYIQAKSGLIFFVFVLLFSLFSMSGCANTQEGVTLLIETTKVATGDNMSPYEFVTRNDYDLYGQKILETHRNDGVTTGTTEYSYDGRGNLISERSESSYIVHTYDAESRRLSTIEVNSFGSTLTLWVYDDLGNVISEKRIYSEEGCASNASGPYMNGDTHEITYAYDIYGNEVEVKQTLTGTDGLEQELIRRYEYSYDGKLLISEYCEYQGDVCFISTTEYMYDKNGQQISRVEIDHQGNSAVCTTEYTYDEKGNILTAETEKQGWFGELSGYRLIPYPYGYQDEKARTKATYTYDEDGYQLSARTEVYQSDGALSLAYTDENTYDQDKNLLTRVFCSYDSSGKVTYTDTISYAYRTELTKSRG